MGVVGGTPLAGHTGLAALEFDTWRSLKVEIITGNLSMSSTRFETGCLLSHY